MFACLFVLIWVLVRVLINTQKHLCRSPNIKQNKEINNQTHMWLSHVLHIYSFSRIEYTFSSYMCMSLSILEHSQHCLQMCYKFIRYTFVYWYQKCMYTIHGACTQAHQLVCVCMTAWHDRAVHMFVYITHTFVLHYVLLTCARRLWNAAHTYTNNCL